MGKELKFQDLLDYYFSVLINFDKGYLQYSYLEKFCLLAEQIDLMNYVYKVVDILPTNRNDRRLELLSELAIRRSLKNDKEGAIFFASEAQKLCGYAKSRESYFNAHTRLAAAFSICGNDELYEEHFNEVKDEIAFEEIDEKNRKEFIRSLLVIGRSEEAFKEIISAGEDSIKLYSPLYIQVLMAKRNRDDMKNLLRACKGKGVRDFYFYQCVIDVMISLGEYYDLLKWLDTVDAIYTVREKHKILLLLKQEGDIKTALSYAIDKYNSNKREWSNDRAVWARIIAEIDSECGKTIFQKLIKEIDKLYIIANDKIEFLKDITRGMILTGLDYSLLFNLVSYAEERFEILYEVLELTDSTAEEWFIILEKLKELAALIDKKWIAYGKIATLLHKISSTEEEEMLNLARTEASNERFRIEDLIQIQIQCGDTVGASKTLKAISEEDRVYFIAPVLKESAKRHHFEEVSEMLSSIQGEDFLRDGLACIAAATKCESYFFDRQW
jgi:hypothetical protein